MLTNSQYAVIESYLPPKRQPPKYSNKQMLEAILFVMSSGCSWRSLPKEYGNWHTVCTRFKRWSEAGVLGRILHELQKQHVLDVNVTFLDSTTVRAHQAAAGARKKRAPKRSVAHVAASPRRST